MVNNSLICGSTWGTFNDVIIYDIIKNEKLIILNPELYMFWCVKPFEEDNQILLGHRTGIMVYNLDMLKKKPLFTEEFKIL